MGAVKQHKTEVWFAGHTAKGSAVGKLREYPSGAKRPAWWLLHIRWKGVILVRRSPSELAAGVDGHRNEGFHGQHAPDGPQVYER